MWVAGGVRSLALDMPAVYDIMPRERLVTERAINPELRFEGHETLQRAINQLSIDPSCSCSCDICETRQWIIVRKHDGNI